MSLFNSITDKIKEHFPPKHDTFDSDKDIDNMLKGDSTSSSSRSASVLEASKPRDQFDPLNSTPPPAQPGSPSGASVSDMLSSVSTQPQAQTSPPPVQQFQQPQPTQATPQFSIPEPHQQTDTTPPSAQFNPLEKQAPPQQGTAAAQAGNIGGSAGLDIHNIKSVMGEVPLQTAPPSTPQLVNPIIQPNQSSQSYQSDSVINEQADDMINLKMEIHQMKEKLNLIIEKLNVIEERTSKY